MAEYIDRQAAIDALRRAEALTRAFGYHNVIETIREMPSADVEPVRHGRWIYGTDDETGELDIVAWTCSLCGEKTPWQPRYCMHCGARMDGESDA